MERSIQPRHTGIRWAAKTLRDGEGYRIVSETGKLIAVVIEVGEGINPSERIPNALLIAAAPTMLEALRRAELKLQAYVGVCKDDKELVNTVLPMVSDALKAAQVSE